MLLGLCYFLVFRLLLGAVACMGRCCFYWFVFWFVLFTDDLVVGFGWFACCFCLDYDYACFNFYLVVAP